MSIDSSQQVLQVLRTLKQQGHRITISRQKIVEILGAQQTPLLAREILDFLRQYNRRADKSTVYRELNFFIRSGLARVVQWGNDVNRFELKPDQHHHHVVCSHCKKVEEVMVEKECVSGQQKISQATKFKILDHSFEFFGLCGQCQ